MAAVALSSGDETCQNTDVAGFCRSMGVKLPVSLTAYSVVGAAAYMGGATRMTLTTTVMVMETTGALQLIVPIMLTVFVAKARLLAVCQGPG